MAREANDPESAPVPRLVSAILLSALHKRASEIAIRRVAGVSRVDFLIDGVEHEEMRPPDRLHEPIIRRLSVMGSLPTYAKGQSAEGQISLRIGSTREVSFALRVGGDGAELAAFLRVITDSARPTVAA